MASTPPGAARFDDLVAGVAWVFDRPVRVVHTRDVAAVRDVLDEVAGAVAAGNWAYGYVGFEAAPAFDPAFVVHPPRPDDPPLAWFAIADRPRLTEPVGVPATATDGDWTPAWTAGQHARAVRAVLDAIAAGQLYQCNLTMPIRGHVTDIGGMYRRLVHAQAGAHNAYLDLGSHVIASASPELFLDWTDQRLLSRPMKGTAPRDGDPAIDRRHRARLLASGKDRAENVMIVDLVRNDLARIADTGTVHVPALWRAEAYETVWQLTSDVTARPRPDVTLTDVFAALFPPGSVVGAPKAAALALIRQLEDGPRGPYCGVIGMLAPPGAPFRARFNVAIRTLVLDRHTGTGSYSVGGGIVADSDPAAEHAEALLKAAVLTAPAQPFQILETLRHQPGAGLRNLDRHLQRMRRSASYFGYPYDADAIAARLAALPDPDQPSRVRLLLHRHGQFTVETTPLREPEPAPVRLAIDPPGMPPDRWCRHKTTRRQRYVAAAARHPAADDVILTGPDGGPIETTTANLAVHLGGRWYTPPAGAGCLPGVERARLLDDGTLTERELTAADLHAADALAVLNSLRGWRRATLV